MPAIRGIGILLVSSVLLGCRGAATRHEGATDGLVAGESRAAGRFSLHDDAHNEPRRRLSTREPDAGDPGANGQLADDPGTSAHDRATGERPGADDPDSPASGVVPVAAQSEGPLNLTLDLAIATSLERNPTLIALRAGDPVAEAACRVAETYPWNPFVQVQVLPYAHDPAGGSLGVNHYVWLMQTLELAHQRRHREAGALASWNQVRWNIVQSELTTAATSERLYFTAIYQRDLRDLARKTAELNAGLLSVVERRFQAGLANDAAQTTARVAARQSRKQAALAEANYQTALLALRRQINVSTDQPIELVGRLEDFGWGAPPGIDDESPDATGPIRVDADQAAQIGSSRPDVMAAQAGANMAQANADLARANTIQNIGIGPFYERDESGTVFAGFRTQMNVPVWDTGRPLARQREAEFAQQVTNLDELRTRAAVETQTALERYERARRLIVRERNDRPRSGTPELERVKNQFEAGQTDILTVFATQNSLLQEQRTYFDLLNELAQAAADVTLAAGIAPARIVSGQANEAIPLPPAARPAP